MWVVIWQAYGVWKITHGFKSEREADKHADMYLRPKDKDYNKHIDVRFIELPASATAE